MGIGSDLKKAREELGITLEAVSEKTKINVPFLEAIEREEWSVFPSQTFAKGFLRAYAKMVKVDTVLATRQFNEEVAPTAVVVSPPFNIESGPIQTALKFPIPLVRKESVPPLVQPPAPAPTPVPVAPPAAPRSTSPPVERKLGPAPKPTSHLRPTAHPKPAPHVAPKDLALEFDEAKAAEERQAVARMLFTRRTTPAEDHRRWFVLALKVVLLVLVLASAAFSIRGFFRWALAGRHVKQAVVENPVVPEPTEAPAPMKPVRQAPPSVTVKPVHATLKTVVKKPIPQNPVAAVQKPALVAQPQLPQRPGVVVAKPATLTSPALPQRPSMVGQPSPIVPKTNPAALVPAAVSSVPAALSPAQAAAQAAAPVDKYHHLMLKGLEASWVLVVVDGRARSEMNLMPGQLKVFQASQGFAIKIGNAAGVDAQYDGRSLGVLGGRGKVVEFVLPMGYHPPREP